MPFYHDFLGHLRENSPVVSIQWRSATMYHTRLTILNHVYSTCELSLLGSTCCATENNNMNDIIFLCTTSVFCRREKTKKNSPVLRPAIVSEFLCSKNVANINKNRPWSARVSHNRLISVTNKLIFFLILIGMRTLIMQYYFLYYDEKTLFYQKL